MTSVRCLCNRTGATAIRTIEHSLDNSILVARAVYDVQNFDAVRDRSVVNQIVADRVPSHLSKSIRLHQLPDTRLRCEQIAHFLHFV